MPKRENSCRYERVSPRWADVLAEAGIEAVHWSELGARLAPDEEITAFAKSEGYVILTHDLDFSVILAATHGDKPSVIQVRSDDVSPDMIGKPVIKALRQMEVELDKGALLSVDPKRTRVHLLPLGAD